MSESAVRLDDSPLIYDVNPGDRIAWVVAGEVKQIFRVSWNTDRVPEEILMQGYGRWQLLDENFKCHHVDFWTQREFLAYLNMAPQGQSVYRLVTLWCGTGPFYDPPIGK